ncbi:MAG: UvrD-helicase domain-containing protein, partial [Mycobacterium sp.]
VRTVHSYAFAVLRLAAQRIGDPPPRLVTGAEQDGIIRELLAGDIEDATGWPESLHPALGTDGFATELRNLLARCAERGVDPVQLQRLGRLSGRPEWTAAGRFGQQYEQVMLLRAAVGTAAPQARVPALGAAELIGAALEAFAIDPELLAAERARIRILLVDDAQQLDPQAARLVRVLAAGADATLIAGDPNQAVFGFRGAEPGVLLAGDPPQAGSVRTASGWGSQADDAPAVTGEKRSAQACGFSRGLAHSPDLSASAAMVGDITEFPQENAPSGRRRASGKGIGEATCIAGVAPTRDRADRRESASVRPTATPIGVSRQPHPPPESSRFSRGEDVKLSVSHRCAPAVTRAICGIARRLPGTSPGRDLDSAGTDAGSVTVHLAASGHAEAALIADALRRAHLIDGVPWSQMAVIVRSVPRAAARLPRALAAAGIPVAVPAVAGALAEQPAVAALLTVLAATADGLDGQRALTLLTGPIGRVDPVSLRQLRRALRRAENEPPADSGDLSPASGWYPLVAALSGDEADRLPARSGRPLRRVRAVLDAAARCHRDGRDPHYTLWQAWHRSGLQPRWLRVSERGGPAGAQAGRDLDAVTALFDVAEQYVSRTAGASLRGLIDHVTALRLAAPRAEPAAGTEAVSLLSAHAALGHEWDLVVIAGLQEGLWPNTVPRGGVLRTQRLLDMLDG